MNLSLSATRWLAAALLCSAGRAAADPQLSSWYTAGSSQYARIYESLAAETAGTAVATWSRGSGTQSAPTYAGVSQVAFSANWVYIRSSGLASHLMGPWYGNAAKTANFPNFPSNTAKIYRIPRRPVIPATKTLTGLGPIGCMVNGVSMFDSRDSFSYVSASSMDATPLNGLTGDGVWNRDGYHNEGITFDPALAHQAGNHYHYHAQPIALRWQLGDHVDYQAATNRYTESAALVARHSPILAWAADGLPVYGPYGYTKPLDPTSGVRRMVSGFTLRDGTKGTDNLSAMGRGSLPAWAQRLLAKPFKAGPAVSLTYALGHYLEDFDYLGDRGFTVGVDFDLNEQNARFSVTPEFPAGTWAYFVTIKADGTPMFPYTTGRQYFGSPSGGSTSISEAVTVYFNGGPNAALQLQPPTREGDSVALTWSAVEGGTYVVEASSDLVQWPDMAPAVAATGARARFVETAPQGMRFYRVSRTSLAAFDSKGFDVSAGGGGGGSSAVAPGGSAPRGTSVTIVITLPGSPPVPPAELVPTSISLGGLGGTALGRPSAGTVQATFALPADMVLGAKSIAVVFTGPTYTLTNAFTIN